MQVCIQNSCLRGQQYPASLANAAPAKLCCLLADTKIWQTKIEKAEGEEDEGEPEFEPFPEEEFGPEGRLPDHWTWGRVDIPDTFGKVEKVSAGGELPNISGVGTF